MRHVLTRPALLCATVVLLLLVGSTPASAAACSNQTVAMAGKPTLLRFVRHGHVSCKRAHRLIRTYFRRATPERCSSRGNICNLDLPGGWSCALPGYVNGQPLVAGCFRGHAFVKAYLAKRGPKEASEFVVRLASGQIACGLTGADQMLCKGIPAGSAPREQVAKLRADGGLTTCTQTAADPVCFQGDLGSPVPHFRPGRKVKVGPFACTVLETGVRCTAASGRGFRISPTAVTRV